jgi:polyisoprenoid-binding protein YceI
VNKIHILVLMTLLVSSSAFAQWELVRGESTINFVSIKKSSVGEVNGFNNITGSIEENGTVSLGIDLGSVDTNVAIRNDRMKSMLFEVAKYAEATISGSVDISRLSRMRVGDTYTDSVRLTLSLHGVSKELATDMQITRLTDGRLLVTSVKPVIIGAEDYMLADGIEQLRTVAKLPSISTAVPVTYSLMFSQ